MKLNQEEVLSINIRHLKLIKQAYKKVTLISTNLIGSNLELVAESIFPFKFNDYNQLVKIVLEKNIGVICMEVVRNEMPKNSSKAANKKKKRLKKKLRTLSQLTNQLEILKY